MPRFKIVVSLSAALLCCLLTAAPSAPANPSSPSSAVVALGDSFISGEGGRWLGNSSADDDRRAGTDRAAYACDGDDCSHDPELVYGNSYDSHCDRSDVAPIKSSAIAVDVRFNLACSGASAENLWRPGHGGEELRGEPSQASTLGRVAKARDVRLVTLTVGANDLGFGEIVAHCAIVWTATPDDDPKKCAHDGQRQLKRRRDQTERRVRKTLLEVRAVMSHAGYRRSDYRLLVMGYASPIPAGHDFRYSEKGWTRLQRGRCPFWDSDASWATLRATPFVNNVLRRVADAEQADFLDVAHALDGHQLCDRASKRATAERPPSEETSEWVRQLDPGCCQGRVRESFHPNAYGQRELGRCIALAYGAGRGEFSCARTGRTIASSHVQRTR
jgi:hypothetical protein